MSREIVLNIDINSGDAEKVLKDIDGQFDELNTKTKKNKEVNEQASQSISELAEESGLFGDQLGILNRIKATYNTGMSLFVTSTTAGAGATSKLTKSLRILKVALIATGIGAIAVAVGTLATAFLSTQEGADALNRVLTPLKTGLQAVWGVIQDIAINFTSVMDGIVSGFRRTAEIAMSIANGEFKQAFDQTKSLISDGISITTDFGNSMVTAYTKGAEAGTRLAELEIELQELRRDSIVPLEELNRQFEIADTKSDNINLSLQERIDAIDEGIRSAEQMNEINGELLDKEIEILQLKQEQNNTTREEEMELQRLLAERIRFESEQISRTRTLENRRNTLHEQQMIQLEEERQLQAEMNKLKGLDEESILERQAILNRLEGMTVDYEGNVTKITRENAEARTEIEENEKQARMNIQMELASSLQSLAQLFGESTILGKALGVTSATIDTYVGANKALAQGGILGPIAAAGIIATGLANVKNILMTQVPTGGLSSNMGGQSSIPSRGSVRPPQVGAQGIQTVQTVFGDDDRNLISGSQKVAVTETDITETQVRVNEIQNQSRF